MQLETYLLPAHWACALINADTSGMEDDDERALDRWFSRTFPLGAHCLDVSDDVQFTRWHDASSTLPFACDAADFTFDVRGAE